MLNLDTSISSTADAVFVTSCELAEAIACASACANDVPVAELRHGRSLRPESHWHRNPVSGVLEMRWVLKECLS